MKWGMALFTLFISAFTQADVNRPLMMALNEPDQLLEQRQAAVSRLKKLVEQQRQGIKLIAEMPVVTHNTTPAVKTVKKIAQPIKKIKIVKAVESANVVAAKNKLAQNKKVNVAVVAWGGRAY